ncbi:MAG: inositol monophosphatase family protein [Pseudomonadota bacterium]|nr:inositol monophosphatase family protein [Pseudomonadota bacterium]
MAQRSALINVMSAAAGKAGRSLVHAFGEIEGLQVSKKGPADFVSEADHRSEKILFGELSKARPNYGFVMEEGGSVAGSDISNTWIIDPLDGTLNFLHGLPHFAISIALKRDSNLFAGLIYAPATDDLFWAEKGKGAFLNGHRLRVSSRRVTSESLFATGIPFAGRQEHKPFLAQLAQVMAIAAGVRRFGSAALDLAYVAAGRYEGFWEQGLYPWDIAAGIVLVREAGGFVSDFNGRGEMLSSGTIIAGNDAQFCFLQKLLTQAGN